EIVDLYSEIDMGNVPFNIFIDLSKAFDCLNHNIIFEKLQQYVIRGKSHDLIKIIFTTEANVSKVTKSNLLNLSTGVPQGS
ncbi:hypothetical protein CAPTEDRAFT_29084, partial [Capitella teleta]